MNRTKLLTLAVVGLLLINIGTLCLLFFGKPGHPRGEGPPPHKRGHGPRNEMIEILQFDETQQAQFDLLIREHRNGSEILHKTNQELHTELYSLLKADTINQLNLDALAQKIAENQTATDKLNFTHFQQVKALCKPEQMKNFDRLADELGKLFDHKEPGCLPQ